MYVIIKAVSIHLKINIIMKSKNVWQKLLVGNEGLISDSSGATMVVDTHNMF